METTLLQHKHSAELLSVGAAASGPDVVATVTCGCGSVQKRLPALFLLSNDDVAAVKCCYITTMIPREPMETPSESSKDSDWL